MRFLFPRLPKGDGMGEIPGGNLEAKFNSGQAGTAWRGIGWQAHGPQR